MSKEKYNEYVDRMQRIADVRYSAALLNWDQEVCMPEKGAAFRGRQLATLSGIAHNMFVDEKLGNLLNDLRSSNALTDQEAKNIVETDKDYSKQKKYSQAFVEKQSLAISKAFHAWNNAKKNSDFSLFQKELSALVDIKLEEAELLGYDEHPYDALMDAYEPGATVAFLDPLFERVKKDLIQLLDKVRSKPQPQISFKGRKFDKDKQYPIGLKLLEQMHYDFTAGRQDLSSHPFSTNFNANDVRVTTRINEDDPLDMITSCIHEGGHALYEQGLLAENYGLPMGEYISLGVHESQSRLWENNVGRSLEFWQQNFHLLQQAFPEELKYASAEMVFHAANTVEPSLIRVQADELTYHFHILIRYEVEKAILSKAVEVKDLPALWNEKYRQYLGINVPNDAKGVLQDIHWSHGSFGYFPTYSLGSFYAAQYFNQAEKEIPGLRTQIKEGNLLPLKLWLNEKIHQYGKFYTADELCKKVTGESLNSGVFMQYIEKKLGKVYGF